MLFDGKFVADLAFLGVFVIPDNGQSDHSAKITRHNECISV